jgi:protein TonB
MIYDMKRLIILSLALLVGFMMSVYAQTSQPSFPGGDEALMQYLADNVCYPENAAEMGIEGVVTVEFIVKADGSIADAKIVRMVDPDLEEEALRLVNSMPRWTPASDNGTPTDARYSLPIKFRLPTPASPE